MKKSNAHSCAIALSALIAVFGAGQAKAYYGSPFSHGSVSVEPSGESSCVPSTPIGPSYQAPHYETPSMPSGHCGGTYVGGPLHGQRFGGGHPGMGGHGGFGGGYPGMAGRGGFGGGHPGMGGHGGFGGGYPGMGGRGGFVGGGHPGMAGRGGFGGGHPGMGGHGHGGPGCGGRR